MNVDIECRRDDDLMLLEKIPQFNQATTSYGTTPTTGTQSPSFTSATATQPDSTPIASASTPTMTTDTLSSTDAVTSSHHDTTAQPGDLGAQDQSKRANKQSEADLTPLLVGKCTKTRLALKFYRWHNQVQYSFLI